jgi:hypothetical protein
MGGVTMMHKYYKSTDGKLFLDPILSNHKGLKELKESEFNSAVEIINAATVKSLAENEQSYVIEQMGKADAHLKLTNEYSSRAVYGADELIVYKEALRNYVRDEDGVLVISTDKPKINGGIL